MLFLYQTQNKCRMAEKTINEELDLEIDDIVIKPNELIEFLKQQFEPEVFDVMINDIVTYVENNIDGLLQYEYDEPEPDWDEMRKERMLRDFESNNF